MSSSVKESRILSFEGVEPSTAYFTPRINKRGPWADKHSKVQLDRHHAEFLLSLPASVECNAWLCSTGNAVNTRNQEPHSEHRLDETRFLAPCIGIHCQRPSKRPGGGRLCSVGKTNGCWQRRCELVCQSPVDTCRWNQLCVRTRCACCSAQTTGSTHRSFISIQACTILVCFLDQVLWYIISGEFLASSVTGRYQKHHRSGSSPWFDTRLLQCGCINLTRSEFILWRMTDDGYNSWDSPGTYPLFDLQPPRFCVRVKT